MNFKRQLTYVIAGVAILTVLPGANLKAEDPGTPDHGVSLPISSDQALSALIPESGPFDIDAEPPSPELRDLLGQASRGPAASVFPAVAPSVVVVRAGNGYGSGFVIDPDGWILTNNHVIASAMIDVDSGSRFARIHFGKLDEGFMVLDKRAHLAFVYAASPEKDLALLKLAKLPIGPPLKPIAFAEKNAGPGSDCFTVGHPSRGLFWSLRSGEVVGIGKYPGDLIDSVMPQFSMTAAARESFVESLQKGASRKALISTCGINPGDSGGPLLNMDGELVAVNFAIPRSDKDTQVNLDKFSYHVHLDEVKAFATDRPQEREVFQPSFWPPAAFSRLLDKDGDDFYETWLFGLKEDEPASGLLWDLDGDTPATFLDDFKAQKADRDQFDFEVVYTRVPANRLFYDSDNDGEFDLILTDTNDDGNSDLSIRKSDDRWEKIDTPQLMLDPTHLNQLDLQEQFRKIVLTPPAKAPADPQSSPSS